jgi:GNAT superfamily N-acetyltransferase
MFAQARAELDPSLGADWRELRGAFLINDGAESPVTQSFGLGVTAPLDLPLLGEAEEFFRSRSLPVQHEICPLAGAEALRLLCDRGYRPIEVSSVLYQPLTPCVDEAAVVRQVGPEEQEVWTRTSADAWSADMPELRPFLESMGPGLFRRAGSHCFLAEADGVPAAAGALSIHEGVALLAGAATLPQFRRRGLQAALLAARLSFAARAGCDLAMMVAEAGSTSQRNAERQGFRIAYTRTKWSLH